MAGGQPALAVALAVGREAASTQVDGGPPAPAVLQDTNAHHHTHGRLFCRKPQGWAPAGMRVTATRVIPQ